jgi:MFS family permease
MLSSLCILLSFAIMGLGAGNVFVIALGIFILDIGVQGMQITNQAIIYALNPEKRSRINSAYMVCYFLGGALGSLCAGVIFSHAGWHGVCLIGVGLGALLVALAALVRNEATKSPVAA